VAEVISVHVYVCVLISVCLCVHACACVRLNVLVEVCVCMLSDICMRLHVSCVRVCVWVGVLFARVCVCLRVRMSVRVWDSPRVVVYSVPGWMFLDVRVHMR
jgi:hypothetical protein